MPTKTWSYTLRPVQAEIYQSLKRFNCLVAHRRLGKTVLCILALIRRCLESELDNTRTHYFAPTRVQAKKVAWDYVKNLTQGTGTLYNESELRADLPNGSRISLMGGEDPDSARGIYSDLCVIDEPSQCPPRLFYEIIRPALSDRTGSLIAIGTPQGRVGLLHELWEIAGSEPDWWRGIYKASETGIIPEAELQAARRTMDAATYNQEFEVSWNASVHGAYWAEQMDKADEEGRITKVAHDHARLVHCAFDLGVNDATACIFFQFNGNEIAIIRIQEWTNTGLPDIVRELREYPYMYGRMVFPHDVRVQSLSTGKTREETLHELGIDVVVAPKVPVIDGIEMVRQMLYRCIFDLENCRHGIEALRQYQAIYDEIRFVTKQPLHNWASHTADAMRYLAVTDENEIMGKWWGGSLDYSRIDRR